MYIWEKGDMALTFALYGFDDTRVFAWVLLGVNTQQEKIRLGSLQKVAERGLALRCGLVLSLKSRYGVLRRW